MGNVCCKAEGRRKRSRKRTKPAPAPAAPTSHALDSPGPEQPAMDSTGSHAGEPDQVDSERSSGVSEEAARAVERGSSLSEEEAREAEELATMRAWLHDDLPLFVINNVLMSVQFFANFEEERQALQEQAVGEGDQVEGHRLRHVKADMLMEQVGTHVVYRPRHGPLKDTEALLHPLRTFLVLQNVQVHPQLDQNKPELPSAPATPPHYSVRVEAVEDSALSAAGYVNLKEIESKEEEGIYEKIGEGSPNSPRRLSAGSVGDMPRSSLTETMRLVTERLQRNTLSPPDHALYAYTTVQSLAASRSLHNVRSGHAPSNSAAIPRHAFTVVKRPNMTVTRRMALGGSLMTTSTYLSSANFRAHFWDVVLLHLARPLRLERELQQALAQGTRIVVAQGKAVYHIAPLLPLPAWPPAAVEFKRPPLEPIGWPNKYIQRRVTALGVHLLPLGYLQRRGSNPDFPQQWRLTCPRAEQLLILHTMHAHVRCYLFTMAIFKTFLRDTEDHFLGLDHTHVLHALFWKLHADFEHWPEDKPAISLLDFLDALNNAIEKRSIKDFFIRDRNLLLSSPILFLNKAQGVLARLLENPLPYILLAVKNLRMRPSFYPELDVSAIYKVATTRNIVSALNPDIPQPRRRNSSDDDDHVEAQDNSSDEESDQEQRWTIQYARQLKAEKVALELEKKASSETINLAGEVVAREDVHAARERRCKLLEMFIAHFVLMARKSTELRACDQALSYLTNARRLYTLLIEDEGGPADFLAQMDKEQQNCEKQAATIAAQGTRASGDACKDETKASGGLRLSQHSRDLPPVPGGDSG